MGAHREREQHAAMKVLHVINSLALRGAETLVANLLPMVKDLGQLEISLWTLREPRGPLAEKLATSGVKMMYSGTESVYSLRHILALAQHFRKVNYDLVHVHLFPAQLYVPLARTLSRREFRLITTEHSTHNRRRKKMFRPVDEWMYRQYDLVACISEGVRQALKNWLRSRVPRLEVVLNGIPLVETCTVTPLTRTTLTGSESDDLIVVMVGAFTEQKDQSTIIRAIAQVPGLQLVLVGDGPLRADSEKVAREFSVQDRVRFLGWRSDVPRILAAADIYVQSSHWEGFGIAALEAMAAGLPVVVSNVDGLREVVGRSGLLFEPGNAEQLAALLRKLAADSALRTRLGQEARVRSKRFAIESTAERYVKLYEELVRQ